MQYYGENISHDVQIICVFNMLSENHVNGLLHVCE